MNPDCFEEKRKSAYEEASLERKREGIVFEEWKNQLIGQEGMDRKTLHFMAALAAEQFFIEYEDDMDLLCERFGWERFYDTDSFVNKQEIRSLVEHLEDLSDDDLFWVLRYCLIKQVDPNSEVYEVMFGDAGEEDEKACNCNGECEGECSCAENPEEASSE